LRGKGEKSSSSPRNCSSGRKKKNHFMPRRGGSGYHSLQEEKPLQRKGGGGKKGKTIALPTFQGSKEKEVGPSLSFKVKATVFGGKEREKPSA